jgi:hypothetical protein
MTPGRSSPRCFEFVFRFQVGSARVSPVAIMIETTRGELLRLASSVIGESPQRFSSGRQNRSRAQVGEQIVQQAAAQLQSFHGERVCAVATACRKASN